MTGRGSPRCRRRRASCTIGAGATLESDVDLHGWWIDGQELVIGEIKIGAGARVGTRSLLIPGASIGADAEIEPGSDGHRRDSGRPALGRLARPADRQAGDDWPAPLAAPTGRGLRAKSLFAAGLVLQSALPLLASLPGIVLLSALAPGGWSAGTIVSTMLPLAPVLALSFVVSYALLVAAVVRAISPLIQARLAPRGQHGGVGAVVRRVAHGRLAAACCSRCTRPSTPVRGSGCSASRSARAPRSRPRSGSTG